MAANLLPRDVPQRAYTSPHNKDTAEEYHHASAYTAPVTWTPHDPPMRSNSARDVPQRASRPYTSPHTKDTAEEYHRTSAYTAPVTWTPHDPPKRSNSDSPLNSLGDSGNVYQQGSNGRSYSSNSFYQPSPQGQPHSFPQINPRRVGETRKPYSSLEGVLEDNHSGNSQHTHTYHPQSISSSPQPHYSGQPSSSRQPSSPRSAAHHDTLHASHRPMVGEQPRAHSDTALTVPRSYPNSQPSFSQAAPHTAGSSALLHSQRFAPRTTEASAALQRSTPNLSQQRYTNAIPHFISKSVCTQATLENARYTLDLAPMPDHPNEDRHFALEGPNYKVFAVFDGHDGPRAAGFASNYMMQLFDTPSWNNIVKNANSSIIHEALGEFFRATEKDFFKSIQRFIDEKEVLQRRIPSGLSSYAAFQQYPREVARLQEIEPKLSGGCTAVLALVVNDKLYVANAGDSRAVLAYVDTNGTISVEQLSVDHSVENENELKRLEALGLDPKQLIKAGRLGMHENTRSIGDYSIKQGYRDVDTLRSARSAPGIVTPYIMPTRTIDHTYQYLLLMTDGVYKSLESTFDQKYAIDPNKVIIGTLERSLNATGGRFENVADSVVSRIAKIHKDCYESNAKKDARSPLAVSCRKRDDMTLLAYRFSDTRSLN